MNETFIQYRDRITQYWNQLSKTQKYMVLGIIVMLVATMIILTINFSKTEYATAFTKLQVNDAANIKSYLDSAKIPYQLSPDGTAIGVPTNQVAAVKLDVESKGLNKNGSLGYGEFTGNSRFGMSENEFNVKYINAVQGEIQQMFNQINGVASSKVMITIPKENVFLENEKQDSSAAAVLNLMPGYKFDQGQIDTMYHLVGKTVPKLKYENITISDQNGEQLPYSKSNGFVANSSSQVAYQFQIKKQFENDIQKKIMQILGGIMGPNKVIPIATATLNFDIKNTQRNLVTPVVESQGIDISVQESQKSYSSDGGGQNGGIPGTGPNDVPGYQGNANAGNVNSEEFQRTVNREVNRIREDIVSSPYSVKDLSISVGIEPPRRDDPSSLTQEMRDSIQKSLISIVSASLADSGQKLSNEELASRVTVLAQPFTGNQADANTGTSNLLYGAGAVALLLIGGLGYVAWRRRQSKMIEEELAALEKVEAAKIDLENVSNENNLRKQLEGLAKNKPQEFVNLLRTWLIDE